MAPTPAGIATPAQMETGMEEDDEMGFAARLKKRLSEENRTHVVRVTVNDANVRLATLSCDSTEQLLTLSPSQPFPAAISILKSRPNQLALLSSAIIFALQYTISFSSSQTFAKRPYLLNPLSIGLILLAFGSGNVVGSVLGGMSSDRVLRRLKEENGGVSMPQVRLSFLVSELSLMEINASSACKDC